MLKPDGVIVDENKGKKCIDILHTGTFAAEKSDSTKPFKDFMAKMQTEINKNESLKKQIEEGGKVFITELKIMGGASNHYNGKETAADLENDYTTPYAGSVEKDSGYDGNIGYAKSRAENLLSAMVSKLPEMSIKLKDGLLEDAKNNIVTKVINTGGKNDHKRPTETHKNPGQIVKIEMKICGKPGETEIEDCFNNAEIYVAYDKDKGHSCDKALWRVTANGEPIYREDDLDYASLNNVNDKYDNASTKKGKFRYNIFKIDKITAEKYANIDKIKEYKGNLDVTLTCLSGTNDPKLGSLSPHSSSGGCHKDTATLVVKIGGETIAPEGGATIKPPYGPGKSTTFRIPACVKQYQKMVGDKES
jgi:uncharacterized membrane protein YkoI